VKRPAFVVAHRGGAGLRPENTLAAFAHAIELGAEGFELDVHRTRDGELVIHHDERPKPEIARLDGAWLREPGPPIHALTLEELRRYDVGRLAHGTEYAARHPEQVPVDGERIPTLRELLALVRARAPGLELWVELKTAAGNPDATPPEPLAEAAIALLREEGFAGQSLLLSFEWRALAHARRIAPEIPRVHSVERGAQRADTIEAIAHAGGTYWFPWHGDVTAERVAAARAAGLRVATWTANRPADLERLIALGLDSICTDHPERLIALRRARGI
jgi:glycerophosphoryl diester phosphodiesterase